MANLIPLIDNSKALANNAVTAGATSVIVNTIAGFSAGQEITIQDDLKVERKVINSVNSTTKTITFGSGLINSYKQGALLYRSHYISYGSGFKVGEFPSVTNYSAIDTVVLGNVYDVSGNGSRRSTRLSNGWIVSALWDTSKKIVFRVSKDNGQSWSQLCYCYNSFGTGSTLLGISVQSVGTMIYTLVSYTSSDTSRYIRSYTFDASTVTDVDIDSGTTYRVQLDTQTSLGTCSSAINQVGTEIHTCWVAKGVSYPNSWNIKYVKGTINANGSITWGSVQHVTIANTSGIDHDSPAIIVGSNGNPTIIFATNNASATTYTLVAYNWNGTSWSSVTADNSDAGYAKYFVSAIFVPQSVNGLTSGRMWVVCQGANSSSGGSVQLRVLYSDNNGASWTSGYMGNEGCDKPVITVNRNNHIFIYYRRISGGQYQVGRIKNLTGSWGSPENVTNYAVAEQTNPNPSLLHDITLDFSEPLVTYSKASSTVFKGVWSITTNIPLTESDVRLNITDTKSFSNTEVTLTNDKQDANFIIEGYASNSGSESYSAMTKTITPINGTTETTLLKGSKPSSTSAVIKLNIKGSGKGVTVADYINKYFTALTGLQLPYSSPYKKENLEYMRTKVNEFRTSNGLTPYTWTDSTIIAGVTPVKAVHWNEIQTAINEVYTSTNTAYVSPEVGSKIVDNIVPKDAKYNVRELGDRLTKLLKALQNIA